MANDTTNQFGTTAGTLQLDGKPYENIDTSKSLAAADSGVIQNVVADAITITVPATVVGHTYIIRNGGVKTTSGTAGSGANGTAIVDVRTTGTDGVTGLNVTAAASKGMVNTKATSQVGDYIVLVGTGVNSAVAWVVQDAKGIWVRQA